MRQDGRDISRAVPRPVAAAFWVAALIGLFGMHGLGDHGAGGHDMSSAMTRLAGPTAVEVVHAHVGGASSSLPTSVMGSSGTPASDEMAVLCLAILSGVVAVLFRLCRRGGRVVVQRHGRTSPALSGRRERDPPCQMRLSVMRC